MKVVCAWCDKEMGKIPKFSDGTILYGICPKCAEKLDKALDKADEKTKVVSDG